MGKRFSILGDISLNKLDNYIDNYEDKNNMYNAYLWMNRDTLDAITLEYFIACGRKIEVRTKDGLPEYQGYRIYIDEDLQFGEVEIR